MNRLKGHVSNLLLGLILSFALGVPAAFAAVIVDNSPDTTGVPLVTDSYANSFGFPQYIGDRFNLAQGAMITGGAIFSTSSIGYVGDPVRFVVLPDEGGAPGAVPVIDVSTVLDVVDTTLTASIPSMTRKHATIPQQFLPAGDYWFYLAGDPVEIAAGAGIYDDDSFYAGFDLNPDLEFGPSAATGDLFFTLEGEIGQMLGSDQMGNLFWINLATGAATLIGQELDFPLSTEIEFDPVTGILYSEEVADNLNLHIIDSATGLSTGFVTHACCALNGMEVVSGVLYAQNNLGGGVSQLVEVDTATGTLIPMGPPDNPVITGMAYSGVNNMYGTMYGVTAGGDVADGAPAQLVELIGDGTVIPGPVLVDSITGGPLDKVGSIEFGPDGVLYGGMGLNAQLNPGWLFSIDVVTGESTFIGPTGFAGITGLTWKALYVPQADLAISKLDTPDPVVAGTELTYTIRVDNIGDAEALDVTVTDNLPSGVTLVSTTGCAEDPAGMPTCSLGTIAAGGFAEYTMTVMVDSSMVGTLINTATAATSSDEPITDNNTATAETAVMAEADLSITKMDSSDPFISGGTQMLIYTIEVSNAGPSDATNVIVTDTLSPLVNFEYTSGCLNDPIGVPDCQLGSVAAGDSASYTITVSMNRVDEIISNSVSVNSDASDPTPGNDYVEETTEVFAIAIPTLSLLGLMVLVLLTGGIGWMAVRRF